MLYALYVWISFTFVLQRSLDSMVSSSNLHIFLHLFAQSFFINVNAHLVNRTMILQCRVVYLVYNFSHE